MTGSGRESHFRPDIEGLRAVAIGAVLLYHAGVAGTGGGFIGVDVFFVISGFLITGLLLREWSTRGSINLAVFYARRFRRLLPAALLAIAVTTVASWLLLSSLRFPPVAGVVALTKAACPPAQVEFGRKEVGAAASCVTWRDRVLTWLADEPPDVVVLTGAGRVYKLLDRDGSRLSEEAALAGWQRGLAATLDALPDSTTTIVLADTPRMGSNPVSCLERNPGDISACVTPRSAAIGGGIDEAERETAEAAGASFESLNHLVCPYDPCPVIVGDILIWRNADHITATFAEQLAPSMREMLMRYLAERPRSATSSSSPAAAGEDPPGEGQGS